MDLFLYRRIFVKSVFVRTMFDCTCFPWWLFWSVDGFPGFLVPSLVSRANYLYPSQILERTSNLRFLSALLGDIFLGTEISFVFSKRSVRFSISQVKSSHDKRAIVISVAMHNWLHLWLAVSLTDTSHFALCVSTLFLPFFIALCWLSRDLKAVSV